MGFLMEQKNSALKVADCTFTSNIASFGGAICAEVGARKYSSRTNSENFEKLLWCFSVPHLIEFSTLT